MMITAQDLYNYTKCQHRVYLDRHGDSAERGEVSDFVKLLWEMGLQTELDHLASLDGVYFENLEALPLEQACERTQTLMAEGAPMIYQGSILARHWIGRPDLLVKWNDAPSRLGDFYYEPIDIKAGRGWEVRLGERTRFKRHYAFQLLFYRAILEQLQGHLPAVARIINVDNEIEEFDPADFEDEFAGAVRRVERLVAGEATSEPVLGSVCSQCQWFRRCYRWVKTHDDPSGLYFVGKQKFALKASGLRTIRDIADMDMDKYVQEPNSIPGVGKKSLERMKKRAQVMLADRPEIRPGYAFPSTDCEIYFDIEDDPTQDLTYLFGMVIKERNDEVAFKYYLARGPQDEEHVARAFWEFLKIHTDVVYYVYSHKERATLHKLMKRYDLESDVFERYKEHEFDLYSDLIVKYSDWPTYSYGIKQIARQVGFNWRDPDPGGANSIAWYSEYVKDTSRQDIVQRILDYNEDDCRAMIAIKDYFEQRAQRCS